MNNDDARKRAEWLFKPDADGTAPSDYEARSRDIRRKIEHLRSLRLAAQARAKKSNSGQASD